MYEVNPEIQVINDSGTFFSSERDTAGCFVVFNLSFGLAQFSCFMYAAYITLWNQILINLVFLLLSLISFTRLDLYDYRLINYRE